MRTLHDAESHSIPATPGAGPSFGAGLLTLLRVGWQRQAQERSSTWSRDRLERHQGRRLQALRTFVAARSPFYQRFHRGSQDRPLQELPILTKATMMENFDALVTDRQIRLSEAERYLGEPATARLFLDRYVVLSTSGTTGRRGVFLFDPGEWVAAIAAITRPIAWSGAAGNLRNPPRSALIASATPWHYSARIGKSLSTRLLPTLRLDAGEPLPVLVEKLNAWQPTALAVYPSVLTQLADEQLARRLKIPLKNVATSAEVLPAETRRRVEQAWGIRVFDTYGATEYAPIAAECSFGNKHFFEDRAIVEVVDEQGRAVAPGERGDRILLTLLERRTQPLIRYEISDMVRELPGECGCGRKFRMIESIEGRVEDVLHFTRRDASDARVAIHPNLFHAILETVPATGWQVVHDAQGLTVFLTGSVDERLREQLRARVRGMLESHGVALPPIAVRMTAQLQRGATGKAPLIVSRIARVGPLP
ncbi:MAG TPA: AMP-binding protein [Burkholderiaceae bacterium]|nr:AMP-binding protein [Burkholderiaceae bacterium]